MPAVINEPIHVITLFKNKPIPLQMLWKRKKVTFTKVNFTYESRQGSTRMIHFTVSSDTDSYKITFDTKNLTWKLNEIYT